jgi:hypothetical protein
VSGSQPITSREKSAGGRERFSPDPRPLGSREEHQIAIRAARRPRDGWSDVFQAMAAAGDDQLMDDYLESQSSFDAHEWSY